jgi:thiamine pyridinylase
MKLIAKCIPSALLFSALTLCSACAQQQRPYTLKVLMYPFIPEYKSVEADVKTSFEKQHPEVTIEWVETPTNYYTEVQSADSEVYELDGVFLKDFVTGNKIRPLPADVQLGDRDLLHNAVMGSTINGVRYGAPHWVCGNFLFYRTEDKALDKVASLRDLVHVIGTPLSAPDKGIAVDLKGKSTLGEFFIESAFDHYQNWKEVSEHIKSPDAGTDKDFAEQDLVQLAHLCDLKLCRNQDYHDNHPEIFGQRFARRASRTLIGYSETLHQVLSETKTNCGASDKCLDDSEISVTRFPSDDKGTYQISWVDSFVISQKCSDECLNAAREFVGFMNSESTYKQILLHEGPAPAYLLPARVSLYSDQEVVKVAHLYPALRKIIEDAEVPMENNLNDSLRTIGATLDKNLPNP